MDRTTTLIITMGPKIGPTGRLSGTKRVPLHGEVMRDLLAERTFKRDHKVPKEL